MSFEEWKIKHKTHKEEKKIEKAEKKLNALKESSDKRAELADKKGKLDADLATEEWFSEHLDAEALEDQIHKARQNLFVQRDKLVRRITLSNREYQSLQSRPDSPLKTKELNRCATASKNAIYALSVVEQAIDRLDDLPDELEWHNIMRDLTNGYKTVNAISVGSDIMTKLAFWFQKARVDMKGDISVNAMEHYYGKPIDQLLESENIQEVPAQLLVKDDALSLYDNDAILEAVRWGSVYNVPPEEMNNVAAEQSISATQTGAPPCIPNPTETNFNISATSIDDFLDTLPSNM